MFHRILTLLQSFHPRLDLILQVVQNLDTEKPALVMAISRYRLYNLLPTTKNRVGYVLGFEPVPQ
jgi:hypothetical protein